MRSTRKMAVRLVAVLTLLAMVFSVASCTIGKGNHEHSYTTEVVAPTCTEKGYTKHTCSCGDSFTDNETPAGHKMIEVVDKQPTCTEDGEAAFHVCSVCGYVEGEKTVIPALGHLYDATYEYPTATENGSKTSVCRTCGDTKTETIAALGVTLPEASKLLAQVIGSFAATLELAKGTELIYVTEYNHAETEELGCKQSLFVEVAEAVLNSNSETVKAHLQIKVGFAETALNGLVSSKDIVVNKNNADFVEIYFFVNGDDISVAMNGQNMGANMSELVYGTLAQMLGLGGYEELQAILENGRLFTELANLRALVAEGVIDSLVGELGNIDAAYADHLADLFALLGEEILVASEQYDGTTIYRLDLAALKTLIAELEGKTVAEYLESVYGKNVVASMADFLEALPDKKIKDIVNAAVTLAENTGLAIGDVYTLIDLYVYTATGIEFSIESQIADRYDMTLVDVIAELSGITGADKLVFVTNLKSALAQIAEIITTVSFEDLLTLVVPSESGAFEAIKEVIDALNEQIIFNFTVDANGNLIKTTLNFAGIQCKVEIYGESLNINATLPDGMELKVLLQDGGIDLKIGDDYNWISVFVFENCFDINVYENRTQVANINATRFITDIYEEVTVLVENSEHKLLEYKHVIKDGVVSEFKALLAGYYTTSVGTGHYIPELDEWVYEYETVTHYVTYFNVSYVDYGTEKIFSADVAETNILITEKNGKTLITITERGEVVAVGNITNTEVVEGEDVIKTLEIVLNDDQNELLNYKQVTVNDVVTELAVALGRYNTAYDYIYNEEFDEWIEVVETTFETFITATYSDFNEEKVIELNILTATFVITLKDGEFILTITDSEDVGGLGVVSRTETVDGDDVIVVWDALLYDGENEILIYNSNTVNGVVTDVYAAVKGYFLHTEHNHEILYPEGEYETKPMPMPEGGYVTGTMPEGGGIIIVPGYTCENCVTVEEYVTWLEVTYTTLEDGTKVLNAIAHDDLNETTEGIDQLTVTVDGDQITGVLYKDEAPIASIGFAFTENTLIGEIKDLQDGANTTMALLEIVLNETLDAILSASLVVNDYEYYYYEDQEPIREIVEIFNGSYEWIDNEEGADNIVIGYNGATYTIGYEITEEGVKLSFTDDAENVVVEFAAIQNGDAITLDLLLAVWGMTYVDGAITLSSTEDTIAIAVDIDHLVVYEGYWSTDYIEFEGALQFKLN